MSSNGSHGNVKWRWEKLRPKIEKILERNPDISNAALARELNMSRRSLGRLLKRARKEGYIVDLAKAGPALHSHGHSHGKSGAATLEGAQVMNDKELKALTEKRKLTTDGNYGTLTAMMTEAPQIETLEGLLEAMNVDTDVWEVQNHTVNKWPGFYRQKSYTEDYKEWISEVSVIELFQVKAFLVRKVPVAVMPTVQPVTIDVSIPSPSKKKDGGVKRTLLVGDGHIGFKKGSNLTLDPFHDRQACEVVTKAIQASQPDEVVILGDMLDLPDWNRKYRQSPDFANCTQPALQECAWWLSRWRNAAPDAVFTYLEGNHEVRILNSILDHLPAAYGIKPVDLADNLASMYSVERLLALDALSIEYRDGYPDTEYWVNGNTRISHGDIVRAGNGKTALSAVQGSRFTEIFGHIHRNEHASKTFHRGQNEPPLVIQSWSFGCLARLYGNPPKGRSQRHDWQQGFGIVESHDDFEVPQVWSVIIQDGQALLFGQLLDGTDLDEDSIDKGAKLSEFGTIKHLTR